jgi:hypothetical protein
MSCAKGNKQKQKILRLCIVLGSCAVFSVAGQADTSVKITELFPRATAQCPEWLELTNTGTAAISLQGWYIGRPGDSSLVTPGNVVIPANGFLVLAKDSVQFETAFPAIRGAIQPQHWHSLDNYHDTLMLWNAGGIRSDSVGWDYRWFGAWTNQSLSRVSMSVSGYDRAAWVLSENPTPGQSNPEVTWHTAAAASLDIGPIPFSPNSDGKDDYLSIRLTLPPGTTGGIALYGFDGRKYYEVTPVVSPEILWNGRSGNGVAVPCGPFFVVAEVKNGGHTQMIRKKGVLWR